MGKGEKKKRFEFDFRHVCDGEPDAETRRQWVIQMGTPYPREYVMALFKEARAKHEKSTAGEQESRTKRPKKASRKRRGTVAATTMDESDDLATATGDRESSGDSRATTANQHPPHKALKQTTLAAHFPSTCSV
jgi:hypothetical protein